MLGAAEIRHRRRPRGYARQTVSGDFGLPPTFEVSEQSVSADTHVIAVRGEFDLGTASAFSEPLVAAIDAGKTKVVADLTEVVFIGSNGLATLLDALRRLVRRGGRMAVVAANPTVLRMFEVTHTDSSFAIFPDREAALASLEEGSG